MNKVESDVPNFEATAAAFAGKDHFVIFKADWCPDCQAVSAVEEALQEGRNPDLNLVVVDVGEKGAYKSPDFVFRTNWVGLKGVPSLYYFSASGEMSKCEATTLRVTQMCVFSIRLLRSPRTSQLGNDRRSQSVC